VGKGFLTGTIGADTEFDSKDYRNIFPRFTPDARSANQGLVALLARIAADKSASPAQIAIAWLLVQKPWIVPIPGTTKLPRREENLGAAKLELTPADLLGIDATVSKIPVQGARYPDYLKDRVGR